MRADRLLSILLLLQAHGRMTTRELAKRLGVTQRTILRDMDALGTAGIPVTSERGASGGWMLVEDYRTDLTGLNPPEVQVLALTRPDRILADLGLDQAAEAAFIKLLAALPSIGRRDAENMRQRIYVDVTGWQRYEEAIPCLPVLQEAIWQDHKVELAYRRSDNSIVERLIDPLGLVARGSVWYLVAVADGDIRTYRVSRIQSAHLINQSYTRPKGFDLATYWEQSKVEYQANLPHYPAILCTTPDQIQRMRYAWRFARIGEIEPFDSPDTSLQVRVHVMFEEIDGACEYVLGFGSKVVVLEPRELREKVIGQARDIVTRYADQEP